MLIFVEGRRTEEQYLTAWHRRHRERVNIEIGEFRGGPLQLVERAVKAKANEASDERKQRGRAHNQIWCVFDRDEHPKLPEAFALADHHRVNVAFSNPCLELWFLLHFRDQTAHLDRHAAQDRAQTHLHCSKVLTEPALAELIERYHDAKGRAISLDDKHAGDGSEPRSNPSSDVWKLIDTILDA